MVDGLPEGFPARRHGHPEGLSARRDGLPEGLSARNTSGSSHQDVFLRDPDEIMQRFPWLRKSLTEGLQWQTIHPSSSSCTWSIAAALARGCGTQDVHEFEVMVEMLDFLDKVASLQLGDEERDDGDRRKGPCVAAAPPARRVVRVEHATVTNADAPLPVCNQSENTLLFSRPSL